MSMTISIDDTLKNDFTEVCAEIGMSASTAFTIFAKRVVRDKRIPFELTSLSEEERTLEYEARAYERLINDGIRKGYLDYLEGQARDWNDVKTELMPGDARMDPQNRFK